MKKEGMNTCPGCKRRCPMGETRCSYGRKYFEKQAGAQDKKHGWEKHLTQGSMLHQLISVGRSAKKALKKGEATEAQLLSSMNDDQQQSLSELLELFRSKNFG